MCVRACVRVCVCVLTGEDKGAGSEASSAVSITFQIKEGSCAARVRVRASHPLLGAPNSQDPASLSLLSISDLIPDLQTIFFWMSNSIEILYFIQQRAPAYTHTIETLQGARSSAPAQPLVTLTHTHTRPVPIKPYHPLCFHGAALTLPPSLSRVKGVAAICHHIGQRGGHDYSGRSDHVHFPAVRLLHHQGSLSRLPRRCPVNEQHTLTHTHTHTHTETETAFRFSILFSHL